MTDNEYKGMVIVIAGYPKEMEMTLSINPGLSSRFTRFCDFPDWTSSDCSNFIQNKAKKEGYVLDAEAGLLLPQGFEDLIQCPGNMILIEKNRNLQRKIN